MQFVEREYWEKQGEQFKFGIARRHELVPTLLHKWIPQGSNKSAFEIGCFPGRYLGILGTLGYQLNGIDILIEPIEQMKKWFNEMKFEVGEIKSKSLEEYQTDRKFDVVCTLGLIEH
jgi:2-polyprenyl-3-methyl-5-hydroxy-6-metoxy-1,4-benzoquinol methylase